MGRNAGQCELEQRGLETLDPGSIALHSKTTPARDGGSRTQHDHYLKFSSRCVASMAVTWALKATPPPLGKGGPGALLSLRPKPRVHSVDSTLWTPHPPIFFVWI